MLRLEGKIAVWVLLVIPALLFGNFVYRATCRFPAEREAQLDAAQDLGSVCTQLPHGIEWRIALQRLNQGQEPLMQRLEVDRLVVQRRSAECIVIFDPSSKQIVKTEIQKLAGWDERNF